MDEIKEKMLVEAESLFMRFGFKSITMDDVARELGVSKKTLYQHFSDKNDLVNQCVESYLQRMNSICSKFTNEKDDAVSILLAITEYTSGLLKTVSQSSMYDLKKYFKSAWDKLEANRTQFIYNSISANLELGIKKGLYRKDIDVDVVSKIYVHLVGILIDPEQYNRIDIDIRRLHMEIIKYHLHAVCTEKGEAILQEKLKSFNKK